MVLGPAPHLRRTRPTRSPARVMASVAPICDGIRDAVRSHRQLDRRPSTISSGGTSAEATDGTESAQSRSILKHSHGYRASEA
jgi:hypothetical protein